ncbi:AAA family ATPase [Acinetobacter baumannii]|uniref:McrB family protein n=1 Tax=Acinetobacter baumannii TaxID=470 RepID=UPI00234130E5|nr:AAA family ATPase [Acinetobacter baumannii]MDC4378858.1 AAA family ATPase [Acinetobacter baumannii]MDV5172764.1 AAA family ATPase [Acinetobacter baumannii]HEO1838279.1 AAA family ATPase [Acinetobacter baumannii]
MNVELLKELYKELINIDQLEGWYMGYKSRVSEVEEMREKMTKGYKLNPQSDEKFLLSLLKIQKNGIASRGQSNISDVAYNELINNTEFLEILENLIKEPTYENYINFRGVSKRILTSVDSNNFPLIFNRAVAACNLDLSTVVDESKFHQLFKYLDKEKILDIPQEVKDKNWYAQNIFLVSKFREILSDLKGIVEIDKYWINIFIWQVYEKKVELSKQKISIPNKIEADGVVTETNIYDEKQMQKIVQPLNRILFGAAGTGKTYHTINHALSILDDETLEELEKVERIELKNRFDRYKENGNIKFVTFHQSFSYEDFIEGICAEVGNGGLSYSIKPGVFKELCEKATINKKATDESIKRAISELTEKAKNEEITFHTKKGAEFKVKTNSGGTLIATTSKDTEVTLAKSYITNYLLKQTEERIDQRSYEWAIAKSLRTLVDYRTITSKENNERFILIIDEINRGNISRIFGELITLIEDSKRQGNDEELSTILPYSKEEFSIPNNLYIIGTMNSSDRSLTGLDVALRRRFEFIEMPPRPELLKNDEGEDLEIDGLNIVKLLTVMNKRIEILLDRDHCIGHANFIPLIVEPKIEKLAKIFQQKIIPQLQEYFFDDWEKIDAVLNGNGMLHKKYDPSSQNRLFKDQSLINRSIWEIKPEAFNDVKNYIAIYNETSEVENELSGY